MASKHRYIKAVGQQNDMACWAACLKWWYRAAMSINPSQDKLWERYKGLREPLGGMSDSGMEHIIGENAMKCLVYRNVSEFDAYRVKNLLALGPIYIAYTGTGKQLKHVNVIYELIGDGPWAEVRVMEPQAVENGDGTWTGEHQLKSLSDYNMQGTIYAGVSKKNYQKWLDS